LPASDCPDTLTGGDLGRLQHASLASAQWHSLRPADAIKSSKSAWCDPRMRYQACSTGEICSLPPGPWCSTGDNNQRPQDVNYSCLPAMAENWAAAGVDPALFRPKLPCVEAARLPIPARFKFAPPAHAAFLLHLLPLPNDRRHLKSQTTTLARQYPTQSPSTTYVNLQ
jgi:hypothetical protein